ncbi:MAG: hypothetical protein ACRDTC_06905 [Pseudonocardiaceae bacterium]
MRTPVTLVAFIIGLIVLFGLTVSLGESFGRLFGLGVSEGSGAVAGDGDDHHDERHEGPGGLAIADQGYVLLPATTRFPVREVDEFRFNIFTVDRVPVTEFATDQDQQDQRMKLVLVRRDLTGYQQLRPTMKPDGTWTVSVRFDEPGSYRAFAIFRPGSSTEPVTLGVDLAVPGLVESEAVPQPSPLARVDDYTVMLDGTVIAGGISRLYLSVLRDDEPVTDLQPYLGPSGHLVMLREGDLGYLRVDPLPSTRSGPTIAFDAGVPTPGYYRVFLDFRHSGEVRTAEFTVLAS